MRTNEREREKNKNRERERKIKTEADKVRESEGGREKCVSAVC